MEIYITRSGQQFGPYSLDDANGKVGAGEIDPSDLAWHAGLSEWAPLSTVLGIMPAPPPRRTEHPLSNLAGRGTRLAATVCDIALCVFCPLPGFFLLYGSVYFASKAKNVHIGDLRPSDVGWPLIDLGLALIVIGVLGCIVTQAILLSRFGQTIGKKIFRIKIVNVSDDARPSLLRILLLRSVLTSAIYPLYVVGQLFFIADVCFIWRSDRRCIHDLLARTKVVNA